ncbi:MAG: catalase [Clostridiales bacterium]|nr:MAG: catalase [Clostridiales bacterium]
MTDSLGRPITNDKNSITVGPEGPVLLQDIQLIDKIAHFDRERIPERVVHAKGAGAFGSFESYGNAEEYTTADFLKPNKKTDVFVRFSTVVGSKGSADTVRDPRGFAVKFYTNEGIYDIVGNDLPVFFIRDGIKFPDVIHALKPSPNNNIINSERFWDFISLTPEATHMITWLYSDRGTIKSYRHVDGFGVNTYVWVDKRGKKRFIKYHWKTMQGIETIDRHEAKKLAGEDPDIATRDLYNAIASNNYPKYELCVQIMDPADAQNLAFDPLDDTKVWDEVAYPLIKIGMMTLNKNPENFFAQVEQVAYCPGNIVPGVELSADKMLQGRSFSYLDTQRHRIGPNFAQLPINRSVSPVFNNQRDGAMTYDFNPSPINYSPNTLGNNQPYAANKPEVIGPFVEGEVCRIPIEKTDDFTQAGEHYNSLTKVEKDHLCDNIAVELKNANKGIQERVLEYFRRASPEFAEQVITFMKL